MIILSFFVMPHFKKKSERDKKVFRIGDSPISSFHISRAEGGSLPLLFSRKALLLEAFPTSTPTGPLMHQTRAAFGTGSQ